MKTFRNYLKSWQNGVLSLCLLAGSTSATAKTYSDLWIFGDSFSDNGSVSEILPLLKAFDAPALPENGKLTDDKLWVEFFAKELGHPSRAETFWKYSSNNPGNFSMIAASSSEDQFTIMDFPEQIDAFVQAHQRFGDEDLVVVQMGTNDALEAMKIFGRLNDTFGDEAAFTKGQEYIDTKMKSYREMLQRLKALGAKNFMVINSPNLGRAPFAKIRNISELADNYSRYLNAKIAQQVRTLSNVTVTIFDLYAKLEQVLGDLSAFGLSQNLITDKPCGFRGENGVKCTNPKRFFYYDLNHPTTQVNKLIANEAIKALP